MLNQVWHTPRQIGSFTPTSILVSILQIILKLGTSYSVDLKEGNLGVLLPPLQFPVWLLTPKLPSTNNANRNVSSSAATEIHRNLKSKATENLEQFLKVLNLSQTRFSLHTTRAVRKDEGILFANQNTQGEPSLAGIWFMPRSVVINIQIHVCVWGSLHPAGLTMAWCCTEEIFFLAG